MHCVAAVMTHDLGQASHTGIVTQLCGDCRLNNFGGYASAERDESEAPSATAQTWALQPSFHVALPRAGNRSPAELPEGETEQARMP